MSDATTKFIHVSYIRSTPDKIFAAITTPEIATLYWGYGNVSDWQPGSKWEMVREEGGRHDNVTGKVVESMPPKRLVIT